MSEFNFINKGLDYAKSQTDEFHKVFGHPVADTPTELTKDQVKTRVNFIVEELVETLAAVSSSNADFYKNVTEMIDAIVDAEEKEKGNESINAENKLVAVADALTDINYFVQGTFTMMGIQPQPLFDIVQHANMSKLGPDGKPIYRESDGKIMKPEGWQPPEPLLEKEIERQKNK
jgi:predicted HAD superfamily Cof-like phosphohydrolase